MLDAFIKDHLAQGKHPKELLAKDGLLGQLTKALVERCLEAEMDDHLGYEKNERTGRGGENRRNGYTKKTVITDQGDVTLGVPRDRNGDFEPQIVQKRQTRLEGFDDKVLALYARGMTVRDIQSQLKDIYGTEVSPALISHVTDAVMDEARAWQTRPLENVYPIVFFDALVVKVRENQRVINKSVYLALAVNTSGQKELLGIWISQNEGAKFWLGILTELKTRGVQDIFIACVDGLTGMDEAIQTAFPKTWVQLCIVHMVRNSLKFVSYKHRKEMAGDLKAIYRAVTEDEAASALEALAEKWDGRYPTVSKSWRTHWAKIIPMFAFPDDIRKVIYTTNAVESVNMTLRKASRNHRIFPNDEAVIKVMYLAGQLISRKWTMPLRDWGAAMNQFSILFEGRVPS
ncbi:MAG: IS256 family transposase [Candidatus Obscuribacter phosphatis]|uniref:Mutator family transposase n=1 Tax=Candidatus Obscuribacter phosphatis TaxID=1906157 RepID=A0A8J7P8S1_9BACT|nr:IS256 family transposase [Candidatus Obscuribacter phosphatis]